MAAAVKREPDEEQDDEVLPVFKYDRKRTTEEELVTMWKMCDPDLTDDIINRLRRSVEGKIDGGLRVRDWVEGVFSFDGVTAFDNKCKRWRPLSEKIPGVRAGSKSYVWMQPVYERLRPLIEACERSLREAGERVGPVLQQEQEGSAGEVNLISGFQLNDVLPGLYDELSRLLKDQLDGRIPGNEYQDLDVLNNLLVFAKEEVQRTIERGRLAQRVTIAGNNDLGKTQSLENLLTLLTVSPREGEAEYTERSAAYDVATKLAKLVGPDGETEREGAEEEGTDEEDENIEGAAAIYEQIVANKHPQVEYKDSTSHAFKEIKKELAPGTEARREEEAAATQFHRYGEKDSSRQLMGRILPLGNKDGASTIFTITIVQLPTPQLLFMLTPLKQVLHALSQELPGLLAQQRKEGASARTETQKARLACLKDMLLFARFGAGAADLPPWEVTPELLEQEANKPWGLEDLHQDMQDLYARPWAVLVGEAREELATCRFFRRHIHFYVSCKFKSLFVHRVRLYWPTILSLSMEDSAGLDTNLTRQGSLSHALQGSDLGIIMVAKALQQGWMANAEIFQPFYERILTGKMSVAMLQYNEKSSPLSAEGFAALLEREARLAKDGASADADFAKTAVNEWYNLLAPVAEQLNFPPQRVIECAKAIGRRAFPVRLQLGYSLLTNAALREAHPGLLEKTRLPDLLALLLEASNASALTLLRKMRDKVLEAADTIKHTREVIGATLLPGSVQFINTVRSQRSNLRQWVSAGGVVAKAFQTLVNDPRLHELFFNDEDGFVTLEAWLREALDDAHKAIADNLRGACQDGPDVGVCCVAGSCKETEQSPGFPFLEVIMRRVNRLDGSTQRTSFEEALETHRQPINEYATAFIKELQTQIVDKIQNRDKAVKDQLVARAKAYCASCLRPGPPLLGLEILGCHHQVIGDTRKHGKGAFDTWLERELGGKVFESLITTGGLLCTHIMTAPPPHPADKEEMLTWFNAQFTLLKTDLLKRFRAWLQKRGQAGLLGRAPSKKDGKGKGKRKAPPTPAKNLRINSLTEARGSLTNRPNGVALFKFEDFFSVPNPQADVFNGDKATELETALRAYAARLEGYLKAYGDNNALTQRLLKQLMSRHDALDKGQPAAPQGQDKGKQRRRETEEGPEESKDGPSPAKRSRRP